jgi:ABC-2 type transport system ATP-binding protein
VLQVADLTKRYGRLTALSEVSFSIRPGEVLGLIGPNGSGKTTLFEWLGGVLPADHGTVLADDRVMTARERAACVFYLPDGIAPWPAQTVKWALNFIVGFFGGAKGPPEGGRHVREPRVSQPNVASQSYAATQSYVASGFSRTVVTIDEVVRQLDLTSLLDSPIGTLSKGQRKRALLAIGLLTPQQVLLADEPFEGLDLRQSRDVAFTLRQHAAAGRTLMLSIHQISDAARVCDRFVLLSGGRIRGEGTLDELSAVAASRGAPSSDLEEVFLALT